MSRFPFGHDPVNFLIERPGELPNRKREKSHLHSKNKFLFAECVKILNGLLTMDDGQRSIDSGVQTELRTMDCGVWTGLRISDC